MLLAVMLQAAGIDNVIAKANKQVNSNIRFYRECLGYVVISSLLRNTSQPTDFKKRN